MIKAKFKGKTSCGFVTGQTYHIVSEAVILKNALGYSGTIAIYDSKDRSRWCPYSSLEAVLMNWELIEVVR